MGFKNECIIWFENMSLVKVVQGFNNAFICHQHEKQHNDI
jgi:hypothetical protein